MDLRASFRKSSGPNRKFLGFLVNDVDKKGTYYVWIPSHLGINLMATASHGPFIAILGQRLPTMHKASRTVFSVSRHGKSEHPPAILDKQIRRMFGLHPEAPAQSITFDSWSPDPWALVASNSATVATLSGFNLTIVSATLLGVGIVDSTLFYTLSMSAESGGWYPVYPGSGADRGAVGPYAGLLEIGLNLHNDQGGILYNDSFNVVVECGAIVPFFNQNTIPDDIFNLIAGANIFLNAVQYWSPC